VPAISLTGAAGIARAPERAMEWLGDTLIEIYDQCEERGMELPFIVCSVSPNGSALVLRVKGDGSPADVLAEHFEPAGFVLPMTIAIVDQRNEAARVTLNAPGEATWQ